MKGAAQQAPAALSPQAAAVLAAMKPGREYTLGDLHTLTGLERREITLAIRAINFPVRKIRIGNVRSVTVYCIGECIRPPRRLTARTGAARNVAAGDRA